MKPRTVWAVYFSATNTTQTLVTSAARLMANRLGAAYAQRSFTLPRERQEELAFSCDDLVVLGVPVYAGRVPNLLLPYLQEHLHGGGALAVPMVVYGNREYDDALAELQDLMESHDFHTIAAAAFIGEHSFSRVLAAGRPDNQDMAVLARFAFGAAEKAEKLSSPPAAPVDLCREQHRWEYYQPRDEQGQPINILKVTPKTDREKCIRCGKCAEKCPLGSIDPADFSTLRGKCMKCCACVKGCPVGAKYFDDPGYETHRRILESRFARRAEPQLFL